MQDQRIADTTAVRSLRRRHLAILAVIVVAVAGGLLAWRAAMHPSTIHIAFANSMTGAIAGGAAEALEGAQLYLDEVNAAGGVDGHPVAFDIFDDRGTADGARANVAAIVAGPALAVLGHFLSSASIAAAAGYQAAHIPALTSQALADDLTGNNPYYFGARTPNSQSARWLARYIANVLQGHSTLFSRAADVDLVVSNDAFGASFARGYTGGLDGQAARIWDVDLDPRSVGDSMTSIIEALAKEPEPRIIVLGLTSDRSLLMVKALRRRGVHSVVVVGAAGTSDFLQGLANEPEERDTPGFFTENMYTTASVIFDTIGVRGQEFAERYTRATGRRPDWIGAGSNDAMRMLIEALRRAHPANTAQSRAADREKIRAALESLDSPEHGVPGLDGPLYFNARHDMPRSLRFGYYDRGRLVSAPVQLVAVQNPDLVDLTKEIDAGHIIQIGDSFFWQQRVVYAGIDIAHLNHVDIRGGTFNADLYMWLRYGGEDDAPTHIEFPDLVVGAGPPPFDPASPIEKSEQDDLHYRLYRISGDFGAEYDLHNYPFDTQSLVVRFQNQEQPRERVVYVIDSFGLHLHRPDPTPVAQRSAFRDLQLWHATDVRYFVDAFTVSSTEGKSVFFDTDARNEYGGFDMAIVVKRDTVAFMIKSLVPLFLLVLVVFATLFFPPSLTKERTTIPVTGILTSAVLLISINNQLPSLGYTIALEYIFYVFFALCLMAMCSGFLSEILRNKKYHGHAIAVDLIARIAYSTMVVITVAVFLWLYALR